MSVRPSPAQAIWNPLTQPTQPNPMKTFTTQQFLAAQRELARIYKDPKFAAATERLCHLVEKSGRRTLNDEQAFAFILEANSMTPQQGVELSNALAEMDIMGRPGC